MIRLCPTQRDTRHLYYCSQRYYDPATCQWISADPAQADGEESAYQYCGGDPIGRTDPTGLRAKHPKQEKCLNVPGVWGSPACWTGAIASVLEFVFPLTDAGTIQQDVFGWACGHYQVWNFGGGQWGLDPGSVASVIQHYHANARAVLGRLSNAQIKRQIDRRQPIIALLGAADISVSISWSGIGFSFQPSAHYVVIDGYSATWSKKHKKYAWSMHYMDPYKGASHWITGGNLRSLGTYAWPDHENTYYVWGVSITDIYTMIVNDGNNIC
jgi:RHS repeat-associated protein